MVSVLLALLLAAALALPALAQEQVPGQTQGRAQAQSQTGGNVQFPAGLVDQVKSLDGAWLQVLPELVRQRLPRPVID